MDEQSFLFLVEQASYLEHSTGDIFMGFSTIKNEKKKKKVRERTRNDSHLRNFEKSLKNTFDTCFNMIGSVFLII